MVAHDRVLVKYLERSQSKHAKARAKRAKGLGRIPQPRKRRKAKRPSRTK